MKTIGLLGGMSWESTATYYREINEGIKQRLGGLHSARILLNSVDFDQLEKLQHSGDWDEIARLLIAASRSIEAGGADFLLICTNTMHKVAAEIEAAINIPLLHIADATAEAIITQGVSKVGLLGTSFTMEQSFYRGRLSERHGLGVLVPDSEAREQVHRVIYDELCLGQIRPSSRQRYIEIISELGSRGAEAVILGCTEIALLVSPEDSPIPLFDTTRIHASKAVEVALA